MFRLFLLILIGVGVRSAPGQSEMQCHSSDFGFAKRDVRQLECLIRCEPFWKVHPNLRPSYDSAAFCRPLAQIISNLFTERMAGECLEGAWQGVLSFPDQLRAYAMLAKSIGASIRAEILEHRAFVEGCRNDLLCRRALARMLATNQARQPTGEYVVSDAELDRNMAAADFNVLAMRLATETDSEVRRCEIQVAQLQSVWNRFNLDGDALAQRRFEVVAEREPQCAGVLGLTPVPRRSEEQQTKCLDRSMAVRSACLAVAKFVTDPVVAVPLAGASAKALIAGKGFIKAVGASLGGAAAEPKVPLKSLLPTLAKPFDKAFKVPGYLSGRIAREGGPRSFIFTEDIPESSLPYQTELRPVRMSRHGSFTDLEAVPKVNVDETSVHLTSRYGGGSQSSDIRLGFLKDGTPVVLKTYNDQSKMLGEAASAEFLSAEGVGPRFHGLYRGSRGEQNIVMDVVPGDHLTMRRSLPDESSRPPNVTLKTLGEADEIYRRLENAGVKSLQEFQLYLTPSGHLSAIDPDRIVEFLAPDSVDSAGRDWAGLTFNDYVYSNRLKMLKFTSPATRESYLRQLRSIDAKDAEHLQKDLAESPTE